MAVTPKDAATLVLLRSSGGKEANAFEVLMVLRHMDSKFVPGSYVFPGGCLGRETFEEVGLLLAYGSNGELISFDSDDVRRRFHSYRRKLLSGEMTLSALLKREGLSLVADRLYYFSHWITPELLPLRYDVRFFIAEAPLDQEALHDSIELTRHVWLTPKKILDGFHRNEDMVLPTPMTIEELSRRKTIAEVIASTANRRIEPILTVMVEEDGGIAEHMPDGRIFRNLPPSV